jgi:hypothetical protein
MIVLKTIGAFFVKIWRWIKDTAWVQPLLIVGAIFAVIFSIPSITSWANNFAQSSANSFYTAGKRNLQGELDNESSASPADLLTNSIYKNTITTPYDGTGSDEDMKLYGTKFFLIYVDSTNDTSKKAEGGFKYLRDNWNKYGLDSSDTLPFKYYTIFKDDTSSNDDSYTSATAFQRYLTNHSDLLNSVITKLETAPYKTRASISDDNYDKFCLNGTALTDFPIPSVCLVDYSAKAIEQKRVGLSEILFTVDGATDSARATLLMKMWNHTDAYSTENLFTPIA